MGAVPRLRESDKLRLGLGGELEKRIPLDKVRNKLFQIRDDNKWVPPYIKPYHVSLEHEGNFKSLSFASKKPNNLYKTENYYVTKPKDVAEHERLVDAHEHRRVKLLQAERENRENYYNWLAYNQRVKFNEIRRFNALNTPPLPRSKGNPGFSMVDYYKERDTCEGVVMPKRAPHPDNLHAEQPTGAEFSLLMAGYDEGYVSPLKLSPKAGRAAAHDPHQSRAAMASRESFGPRPDLGHSGGGLPADWSPAITHAPLPPRPASQGFDPRPQLAHLCKDSFASSRPGTVGSNRPGTRGSITSFHGHHSEINAGDNLQTYNWNTKSGGFGTGSSRGHSRASTEKSPRKLHQQIQDVKELEVFETRLSLMMSVPLEDRLKQQLESMRIKQARPASVPLQRRMEQAKIITNPRPQTVKGGVPAPGMAGSRATTPFMPTRLDKYSSERNRLAWQ